MDRRDKRRAMKTAIMAWSTDAGQLNEPPYFQCAILNIIHRREETNGKTEEGLMFYAVD